MCYGSILWTISWISTPSKEYVAIHEELAYNVVCAHELCEDPSSNTAAFGFSAHKSDGTVIKTIKFPLLFSSGKLAPLTPKDLDISTINKRFSKTLDILSQWFYCQISRDYLLYSILCYKWYIRKIRF